MMNTRTVYTVFCSTSHLWRLIVIGALLVVTGCGFQLKGSGSAGAQLEGTLLRLVSSQPRSELTREVTQELTANGLILTDDGDATLILTLQPEQFTQRNVSLTAQARAAELELTLAAEFTLEQADHDPIDARATVNRQMLNDPRNVVGKTEELRLLRDEMRRDLAAQIVRRLSHSVAN
jgi:LPS-assembly lipoprotein